MASPSNPFDFAAEDLAAFLAKVKGDGTFADLIQTAKKDQAGLETDATEIDEAAGAIYGDTLDDFILAAYPLLRSWANYVPPALPDFVSPTTVFEVDWTAEPSSGPLADGPISVDGKTWTVVNSANASQFEIVNGVGLVIAGISGSNRDLDNGLEAGSNAPYIYCNLETLAPECARYDLPITIWGHVSSWSLPIANNSILAAGIGWPASPYSAQTWGAAISNYLGLERATYRRASTQSGSAIALGTHDVVIYRSPLDGWIDIFSGEWSGDWPARDALSFAGRAGVTTTFETTVISRHPDACLMLGVETRSATAGSNPSATFARTKIEIG